MFLGKEKIDKDDVMTACARVLHNVVASGGPALEDVWRYSQGRHLFWIRGRWQLLGGGTEKDVGVQTLLGSKQCIQHIVKHLHGLRDTL